MAEKDFQLTQEEIASTRRNTPTEAIAAILELAEQKGISPEELAKMLGVDLSAPDNKLPIIAQDSEENFNEFVKIKSKGSSIPGQSLTNSPDEQYAWEQPPEFVNLQNYLGDIYNRILTKESINSIMSALAKGTSVEDVVNLIVYLDFTNGKMNPDLLMLAIEPVFYVVLTIAEKSNVDYRLTDDDEDAIAQDSEKYTKSGIDVIKNLSRSVIAEGIDAESVPEELQQEVQEKTKSLLAKPEVTKANDSLLAGD